MKKVLIDADGCPVVDLTIRICRAHGVPVLILCDTAHRIERDGAETMVFDKGADSVDFALVNRACPGDIVVTQDYGLAAMFYTQAFQVLCAEADRRDDGRLPFPVRLFLDDFVAGTYIENFDRLISVIRSRNISVSIILQSLTQLKSMYSQEQADTIITNCDHLLYLGGGRTLRPPGMWGTAPTKQRIMCCSCPWGRHIYRAIQKCHEEQGFSIEGACELLHVVRSAYHKWASGKLSRRTSDNEQLAGKIERIHMESPDKGYRRLNDDLRHDYGIHINDKRVLRICRARDIRSTVKYHNHGCTRQAKNPQYLAENLLGRQFYADKPNEK